MSVRWHDVSGWEIGGKAWTDTFAPFDRLPRHAKRIVRDRVWELSRYTTGLYVDFESDSSVIKARWKLTRAELSMPHMPASACSGVDLYTLEDGVWRWMGSSNPAAFPDVEAELIQGIEGRLRRFRLYFPLYNGLESLEIGVSEGAAIRNISPSEPKSIAYYGTSVGHGASASRPGMPHVAQLGRRLGVRMYNLSFSGNGRLELEIARLLAELDPDVYVIDCLPNITKEIVDERGEEFIRILRGARPLTPIVLVECRTYPKSRWVRAQSDLQEGRRSAQRLLRDRLVAAGVPNLIYVDGDPLIGEDGEGTVDGIHPSDLGFYRYAEAMEPVLRSLL